MSLLSIPISYLPLLAVRFVAVCLLQAPPLSQLRLSSIANSQSDGNLYNQHLVSVPFSTKQIATTARQISVRILTHEGMGTGIIIARQGHIYEVLTNSHVVNNPDQNYTILTADGQTHAVQRLQSSQFGDKDLALVQFASDRTYQVAAIGDSNALSIGDPVYAAGFPSWHWVNSQAIEDTRNWGIRAFRFTEGIVKMLPEKSLQQGYQLGYTNEIESGMSGGPVLDKEGRLIGVNGGLKYPPQGKIAFIFADGTMPSEALFQQMESLSWAIPINTFLQNYQPLLNENY